MRTNIFNMISNKTKCVALAIAAMMTTTSCIETTLPTSVLTADQIKEMASSQEGLLNGIVSYMITVDSWGGQTYPVNDWGYPCQMYFRETQGQDFPVLSSGYNYWYSIEAGTETRYTPYYTYRFYYNLVKCCNNLIGVVDPETAPTLSRQYLGCALAYRAMAYLDMARMFEYKRTGVPSVDAKADELGCWGLTVPIVTEDQELEQIKQNKRAHFTDMYRFILTDLNRAQEYIDGFTRASKTLPDKSVVYGLKARLYLELGSRFENAPEDLQAMIESDASSDTYDKLGVQSARECYSLAREYARKAQVGYSPTTAEQWLNSETGFNTSVSSWMWDVEYTTKEQLTDIFCSFTGTINNEADWSMGRGYSAVRMIGSALYSMIEEGDWRRWSFIDPNYATTDAGYDRFTQQEINGTKISLTTLTKSEWKALPAYASTKFRYAAGGKTDYEVGCLVDIPLMRMEEMKFIEIETTAYLDGLAAGTNMLRDFINTYRYTDGSYTARNPVSIPLFLSQLMTQKRIEFWGEGINYFDYKRLRMQVRRSDNTNYESQFMLDSVEGYVAPWMNYYILEFEADMNPNIVPNPDTSGCITATVK